MSNQKRNVREFFNLVEVLETFVSQSDGDGENGVGGVLIKASFTVSSKQSQGPAPTDIITHAN